MKKRFAFAMGTLLLFFAVGIAGVGYTQSLTCRYGLDVSDPLFSDEIASSGASVLGSFSYTVWNSTDSRLALVVLLGIADRSGNLVVSPVPVYGPAVPGQCRDGGISGKANLSISAPALEGEYDIVAYTIPADNVNDALNAIRNNLDYQRVSIGSLKVVDQAHSSSTGFPILPRCRSGFEVWNISQADWNVTGGSLIFGSFDYTVWNREGETGVMMIQVGIRDVGGNVHGPWFEVHNAQVPGECREGAYEGTASFSLSVPTQPGRYAVIAYCPPAYGRQNVLNMGSQGVDPLVRRIGTLRVR